MPSNGLYTLILIGVCMLEKMLALGQGKKEDEVGETRFYGEVTTEALIDGVSLATAIGLTAGTAQNTTEPWLAFELDGKLLLVAKKTLRHTISWDQIQAANAVYGSRSVDIHGSSYRIRLLKGAATDPISGGSGTHDPEQSWGSEWNRLFYPLVPNPVNTPTHPTSREGIRYGAWANYTETQLNIGSSGGNGRITRCQELSGGTHVIRGNAGLSYLGYGASSYVSSAFGWRPVLELDRTTPEPEDVFLGEVPVTKLISGDALATQVGLTAGTAFNSNEPWLKFLTREGKTLYVAKKPFRYNLNWNQLNTLGITLGVTTVVIGGNTYKVRLLTGMDTEYYNGSISVYNPLHVNNSEWNRLMYPLHNGNHIDTNNLTLPGYWPLYSDLDLGIGPNSGNGGQSWCIGRYVTGSSSSQVTRGGRGITSFDPTIASSSHVVRGWRPVLELV